MLGVSVLFSLEIHLGLYAGPFKELMGRVLVRFGVSLWSLSWPGFMSTGVPVFVLLSFCLRCLFWSNFR